MRLRQASDRVGPTCVAIVHDARRWNLLLLVTNLLGELPVIISPQTGRLVRSVRKAIVPRHCRDGHNQVAGYNGLDSAVVAPGKAAPSGTRNGRRGHVHATIVRHVVDG